jgi:hypothetical protein
MSFPRKFTWPENIFGCFRYFYIKMNTFQGYATTYVLVPISTQPTVWVVNGCDLSKAWCLWAGWWRWMSELAWISLPGSGKSSQPSQLKLTVHVHEIFGVCFLQQTTNLRINYFRHGCPETWSDSVKGFLPFFIQLIGSRTFWFFEHSFIKKNINLLQNVQKYIYLHSMSHGS